MLKLTQNELNTKIFTFESETRYQTVPQLSNQLEIQKQTFASVLLILQDESKQQQQTMLES